MVTYLFGTGFWGLDERCHTLPGVCLADRIPRIWCTNLSCSLWPFVHLGSGYRPFSDPCSSLMFTVGLILNFQHDVWKLFEAWDQNHFFEGKKDNELSNRYTIMGAHCLVGVYCSIFLEVTVTWKGDSPSHRRIWISNVMAGKLSDRFFFAFDLDFPEILSSNLFEQLAHTPKTII